MTKKDSDKQCILCCHRLKNPVPARLKALEDPPSSTATATAQGAAGGCPFVCQVDRKFGEAEEKWRWEVTKRMVQHNHPLDEPPGRGRGRRRPIKKTPKAKEMEEDLDAEGEEDDDDGDGTYGAGTTNGHSSGPAKRKAPAYRGPSRREEEDDDYAEEASPLPSEGDSLADPDEGSDEEYSPRAKKKAKKGSGAGRKDWGGAGAGGKRSRNAKRSSATSQPPVPTEGGGPRLPAFAGPMPSHAPWTQQQAAAWHAPPQPYPYSLQQYAGLGPTATTMPGPPPPPPQYTHQRESTWWTPPPGTDWGVAPGPATPFIPQYLLNSSPSQPPPTTHQTPMVLPTLGSHPHQQFVQHQQSFYPSQHFRQPTSSSTMSAAPAAQSYAPWTPASNPVYSSQRTGLGSPPPLGIARGSATPVRPSGSGGMGGEEEALAQRQRMMAAYHHQQQQQQMSFHHQPLTPGVSPTAPSTEFQRQQQHWPPTGTMLPPIQLVPGAPTGAEQAWVNPWSSSSPSTSALAHQQQQQEQFQFQQQQQHQAQPTTTATTMTQGSPSRQGSYVTPQTGPSESGEASLVGGAGPGVVSPPDEIDGEGDERQEE